MLNLKRIAVLTVVFAGGLSLVMGQSADNNQEMSVEESYLQESVGMMIIKEQSRAVNRENKLIALAYIDDAIKGGNTGEDVRSALEYIAMEGLLNKTYENGRLVNNYPDVRMKAAAYLGELGTPEAKETLLKVMLVETEPSVLSEAVKSLGKIGINDHDETVNTISWIVTRFDVLNPDNLLALSALDAYETFAQKNGGIKDPSAIRTIMRISEGPYIKPVQERARQVMSNLRKYSSQNQNNAASRSGN